jgi:hypothetical protein
MRGKKAGKIPSGMKYTAVSSAAAPEENLNLYLPKHLMHSGRQLHSTNCYSSRLRFINKYMLGRLLE